MTLADTLLSLRTVLHLFPLAELSRQKSKELPQTFISGCLDNSKALAVPPGAPQLAWRVRATQK